jgi:hypothetical protein
MSLCFKISSCKNGVPRFSLFSLKPPAEYKMQTRNDLTYEITAKLCYKKYKSRRFFALNLTVLLPARKADEIEPGKFPCVSRPKAMEITFMSGLFRHLMSWSYLAVISFHSRISPPILT